jgi:transketolase
MTDLDVLSTEMRIDIVRSIEAAGSGHPGGSLSAIDILCALYFGGVLKYDSANPADAARDRFILAKGHAAPALYVTLAHAGYFPREELATLRKWGSRLQGHPDSKLLPGVEVSTGSLGQGLSIACGMATGLKMDKNDATVFALLGDGECEEGQVWEAAMFASSHGLDNLVAIVDNNGLQIDGPIKDVCDPGDIGAKFAAFGFDVVSVDGHDVAALIDALAKLKDNRTGCPKCLVAKTHKGQGVSFMQDQVGWHGKAPSKEQADAAVAELAQNLPADLAAIYTSADIFQQTNNGEGVA